MREMHAHELEGHTVIIETVPDRNGKKHPFGYMLQVRLQETGLVVPNVSSINIAPMPLVPNAMITAEITLCHIDFAAHEATYETVTVQHPALSFAAEIEKENVE